MSGSILDTGISVVYEPEGHEPLVEYVAIPVPRQNGLTFALISAQHPLRSWLSRPPLQDMDSVNRQQC